MNLHPSHMADLKKSGLSDEMIQAAGIYSVRPGDISKKLGINDTRITSLMAIPYPGHKGFERFKPFPEKSFPKKYYQRYLSKNHLYIPASVNGALSDPSRPLHINEGEKNASN